MRKKGSGHITEQGYLRLNVKGKRIFAHRMIWEKYHGEIPKGYVIHHKDENKLNNDISNLELKENGEHSREHSLGKVLSQSTKSKISESKKGKSWGKHTEQQKRDISKSIKKWWIDRKDGEK